MTEPYWRAMPAVDRFWTRVEKTPTCWLWTGLADKDGYGILRADKQEGEKKGRAVRAPKFSYELHVGVVPEGLLVLHKCDNPPCVRPDHLYVGTFADNGRDVRERKRNPKARQTACKRGHEFTPENTIFKPNGTRKCRACGNSYRNKGIGHTQRRKFSAEQVLDIRSRLSAGATLRGLARELGVTDRTIKLIKTRETYSWVSDTEESTVINAYDKRGAV